MLDGEAPLCEVGALRGYWFDPYPLPFQVSYRICEEVPTTSLPTVLVQKIKHTYIALILTVTHCSYGSDWVSPRCLGHEETLFIGIKGIDSDEGIDRDKGIDIKGLGISFP